MSKTTIAIDIDGTLRNISDQMEIYLESDYPNKAEEFRSIRKDVYRSLDPLFDTKEDLYKWMYEERVFQIFAMAQRIHPRIIDDLNIFAEAAKQKNVEVVIASVQRDRSVTATLYWLAKWGCKIQRIEFFNSMQEKIDRNFDIYLDDCPEVISAFAGKTTVPTFTQNISGVTRMIKIPYNFTDEFDCPSLDVANGEFDNIYEILGIEKIIKK